MERSSSVGDKLRSQGASEICFGVSQSEVEVGECQDSGNSWSRYACKEGAVARVKSSFEGSGSITKG